MSLLYVTYVSVSLDLLYYLVETSRAHCFSQLQQRNNNIAHSMRYVHQTSYCFVRIFRENVIDIVRFSCCCFWCKVRVCDKLTILCLCFSVWRGTGSGNGKSRPGLRCPLWLPRGIWTIRTEGELPSSGRLSK